MTLRVLAGLVVGKPVGVFRDHVSGGLVHHARLDDDLAWRDVLRVRCWRGSAFTVSLLIGELAFGHARRRGGDVKVAVLLGIRGLRAAGCLVLLGCNAAYRRIHAAETGTPTTTASPTSTVDARRHPAEPRLLRTLVGCLNRSADPQIFAAAPFPIPAR